MILVVGSTGLLGSEICRLLAEKQMPFRALVRRDSAPEKVEHLKSLGADLAVGDLKDPASLIGACAGVEKVISTASSTFSRREGDSIESVDHQGQLNLVRVAEEAGVKRFVFISFRPNPDHPSPLSAAKRAVEQALAGCGMIWCSLRANFFLEIWLSPAVGFNYPQQQANLYGTGDQKISWVSFKDVAAFAVAALDSPQAKNRVVEVGGTEALSPNEVVRLFENTSGHPFAVQHVPAAALAQQKAAAANPLEESFAALMLDYAAGNVMDMGDTLRYLPVRLTPVEKYVRGVVGKM
jgi:uncharacterized protein YbjT (DUF2867 family)